MNKYFMTPDEYDKLLEKEKSTAVRSENGEMNQYFKPAGDLDGYIEKDVKQDNETKIDSDISEEKVKDFLSSIVSGKRYPTRSEKGLVCSEAVIFVSLEKLIDMVNLGNCNIVSAKYINKDMIEIQFQEFLKDYKEEYSKRF